MRSFQTLYAARETTMTKLACVDASVDTKELSPESRDGKMRAMPVLV